MKNLIYTSKRGSAILAMLIVVLVLSALSGTYLSIAMEEYKMSQRTSRLLEAMNIAEAGVEEAIYFMLYDPSFKNWQKISSTEFKKRQDFPDRILYSKQKDPFSRVWINYQNPDKPILLSEGVIPHQKGEVRKQIRLDLTRRGLFANGLTAKDRIGLKGNKIFIDSYRSSDGPYIPLVNQGDKGTVGSVSVAVDSVDIQNADVLGFVATGGGNPRVGSNGSVRGFDTPIGTKIDASRITRDFNASFDMVSIPNVETAITSISSSTIGSSTATSPTVYHLPSLTVKSSQKLTVDGPVILVVDGDIDVKGEISLTSNANVKIYVKGDVNISGNGIANPNGFPADLAIFGTEGSPGNQTIKMAGNGALNGVIYAPNADLELRGGGSNGVFFGAAVAYNIDIVGNYAFHYDEDLDAFNVDRQFRIEKWKELITADERVDFSNNTELAAAAQPTGDIIMEYDDKY